jgi:dihydroorotate dehydrogenase electron transfer subunit
MNHYKVRLSETLLEGYQNAAARLAGPAQAVPKPGQYIQAHDPSDALAVLPTSLFLAGVGAPQARGGEVEFAVAGPLPASWQPGTWLQVRGPLGHSFAIPQGVRHIALAASGRPDRLLPLLAAAPQAETALFCDAAPGELPTAIEVQPLAALAGALAWADYVAIDMEPGRLDDLPTLLGIKERLPKTLRAQALVTPPLPCGGLARCGVCTLAAARGPRLACEDGPVFDLGDLI